nr:HlyD family efflux transporter periplasmic adaptor subunit [Oceanococcus sp. HetDA_MAG_MS8]
MNTPQLLMRQLRPLCLGCLLCAAALSNAASPDPSGPHGGRILTQEDIAVELKLVDEAEGTHMYAWLYTDNAALSADAATLTVALERLDGQVNPLSFSHHLQGLRSVESIAEPHSFTVKVRVEKAGSTFDWSYDSFEGRTHLRAETADISGLKTSLAGPATVRQTLRLSGQIHPSPTAEARISAPYTGTIQTTQVQPGQQVRQGQTLARVQSLDSLQSYGLNAPFDGWVVQHQARVGEVATPNTPLFVIVDLDRLWVELAVLPADIPQLRPGLPVHIEGLHGRRQAQGHIQTILPSQQPGGVHYAMVEVDNSDRHWHLNEFVDAQVELKSERVPLAVRREALQSFRGATVVFAQFGQTYEVRPLELGAQDAQWAEVRSGLAPGTSYVTQNSYLIKADIEKSGAAHDH